MKKPKMKCKINYEKLTYKCRGKKDGKDIEYNGKFIRDKNGRLKLKEDGEFLDSKERIKRR